MPVYDDEKVKQDPSADQLQRDFDTPAATTSGSDTAKRNAETKQLEDAYNAPDATESGSDKLSKREAKEAERAAELKAREEHAEDRKGYSAADDARERLGLGYTGPGSTKSKGLTKMFGSSSKLKKRAAIAGAVAGGSLVVSMLVFLALIPLKIESIMHMVDDNYSASVKKAMNDETDALITQYFAKRVLPALKSKACAGKTYVDATCVGPPEDGLDNPVSKTFRAWHEQGIERKLAQAGLVLGAHSNGNVYISYKNVSSPLDAATRAKVENLELSIFDTGDAKRVDRQELRRTVREAVKTMTFRDRVYMRFRLGKMLERKYGVKRCFMVCKITDPITEKKNVAKQYAKAQLVQRVITPRSEAIGMALECLISGTCGKTADANVDVIDEESGTQGRVSQFQSDLSARLESFSARYGTQATEELLKSVDDIEKEGTSKYLMRTLLEKLLKSEGAAKLATSASGPVQVVLLLGQLVHVADTIGDNAKQLSYAINVSAVAIPLYMAFQTTSDEVHGGARNLDTNHLGSMIDMLDNNDVSMSASPVYSRLSEGYTTAPTSTALLPTAFAATASGSTSGDNIYRCQDGKPSPADGCTELDLAAGNDLATAVSAAIKAVPGLSEIGNIVNSVNSVINSIVEKIAGPIIKALQIDDLLGFVSDAAMKVFKPVIDMITNALITNVLLDGSNMDSAVTTADTTTGSSLFSTKAYAETLSTSNSKIFPSGARMFELVAAGANASFNDSCVSQLGCVRVSDQQAAAIRDEYMADQQAGFRQQSMFARVFDTSTPLSFVSRLSLVVPSSSTGAAQAGVISVTNTLGNVLGGFSTLLSSRQANAEPGADFFGIDQNAFPTDEIEKLGDQAAFWDANCAGDKKAAYDQAWRESMQTDPETGVAYATRVNACQFIATNTLSLGGYGDPTMLPSGANESSTSTVGTIPSGTSKELAAKILASDNITWQSAINRTRFQEVAATGGQSGCGSIQPISPKLLGTILALSEKYKIVLGVLVAGHSCNDGDHPKGLAIDINGVNPLSGSGGTGNFFSENYGSFDKPIAREFYEDLAKILSENGGGKINQYYCFAATGAKSPSVSMYKNVNTSYPDSCDHLHTAVNS